MIGIDFQKDSRTGTRMRSRRCGTTSILTVRGPNDRNYQTALYQAILGAGANVALEFDGVDNVNSGFIGLLAAAARELQAKGGGLYVLAPPQAVRRLVALSGIGSVVQLVEDESSLP